VPAVKTTLKWSGGMSFEAQLAERVSIRGRFCDVRMFARLHRAAERPGEA